MHRAYSDSVIYYRDPFNRVELENTIRGHELVLFVIFYVLAVGLILVMFEAVMPVLFTDGASSKVSQRRKISFS